MNKAAQVAGGVFSELVSEQDFYHWRLFSFGITIGQLYGRSDEYFGPKEMLVEIDRISKEFPRIAEQMKKAVTLFDGGMNWIEAIERCSGYYDEATGKPLRELEDA